MPAETRGQDMEAYFRSRAVFKHFFRILRTPFASRGGASVPHVAPVQSAKRPDSPSFCIQVAYFFYGEEARERSAAPPIASAKQIHRCALGIDTAILKGC